MLETPHVLVGAAIASKIGNPALALPLALGSHFILDLVPHWNPHLYTETQKFGKPSKKSTFIAIIDASLALILGSLIALKALPNTTQTITILLACFLSVLPDLVEGPYYFLNLKNEIVHKWILWHRSYQSNGDFYFGIISQLLIISASIWWIIS
jgi:hypothetical protein